MNSSSRNFLAAILLAGFVFLPTTGFAQFSAEEGPIPPSWRDVEFVDTAFERGEVLGRIYYPAVEEEAGADAELSNGPYPLVAFMHGWLAVPENYDRLLLHLASWGFVVASIGTEVAVDGTMRAESQDTQALLHWVAHQSKQENSWLSGMVAPGPWGASGHSMGGGACLNLIHIEPNVRAVAPLQPFIGRGLGGIQKALKGLETWDGAVWFIAGGKDETCPTKMVRYGYDLAKKAERKFWTEAIHMGHLGPCNYSPRTRKLSGQAMLELHQNILSKFFLAELKGEENLYPDLLRSLEESSKCNQEQLIQKPFLIYEKPSD
ncbi:MAG: hypothetical protein MK213_07940 [Planctomycetes bacterium]|nr:hypothetical protein [Planctomycetota bacterium]